MSTPPIHSPFFDGEIELPGGPNRPALRMPIRFRTTNPAWAQWVKDVEEVVSDADIEALAALAATAGLLARTGAGAFAARTLTAPAAGITVSNGTGESGNPTLALANDLSALEALASTGLAARTGTDAWAQRTITGTANQISVSNGSGASGNPTLSLAVGDVVSGTYSPTVTAVTNVDSASLLGTADYMRVGAIVVVFFAVRINATTAGAAIEVGVSLPVASALGAVTLWGSVAATDVAARGLGVVRDTTNDRAAVVGIVAVDTQVDYAGSFGYLID